MKIHSNLRAGMTFAECNSARNAMKQAAQTGNCAALNWDTNQAVYPTQLPSYPPAAVQPVQPAGGGYYYGVYYPDRSGSCG